jgi:hypothetical protein
MRPLRLFPLALPLLLITALPLLTRAQDAPAVDAATLLKELHRIRDQQTVLS